MGEAMNAPQALAVVVPAHNEEELIDLCLRSIQAALARSDVPVFIVVVAHRCTDSTEQLARRLLTASPALVLADDSPTVATARAAAVSVKKLRPAGVRPPWFRWVLRVG